MFESFHLPVRTFLLLKNKNAAANHLQDRVIWTKFQRMGLKKVPAAFLVLKDIGKKEQTLKEMRSVCEATIAPENRIRGYAFLDKLPLIRNEKIN